MIELVLACDWAALYLNGFIYVQNHSISNHDWASAINNQSGSVSVVIEYSLTVEGEEWLMDNMEFPLWFSDIPSKFLRLI